MKQASGAKAFRARLEKGHRALGWTIARVPFDPAKAWPKMVRLRVQGTIAGARGKAFAFRTSLFPNSAAMGGDEAAAEAGMADGFCLLVNHAMQRGAGVKLGDEAAFTLEPDLDERPAEMPEGLAELLDEEEGLRAFYDQLSEYTRREIGKWILGVKSDEARMNRCAQLAERLLSTMEAERELPPIITRAFQRRPKARAGWPKLTETQRRNELMAVFYYRSPEAREKRVQKLCELAEKKA